VVVQLIAQMKKLLKMVKVMENIENSKELSNIKKKK
jgi:hypothetical protein